MEQCQICKHSSGRPIGNKCPDHADGELPCAGFENWEGSKLSIDAEAENEKLLEALQAVWDERDDLTLSGGTIEKVEQALKGDGDE